MLFVLKKNGAPTREIYVRKILHVTESLAGGVFHAIALLVNEQARAGYPVTLIYSIRTDTPVESTLASTFDATVERIILPMRSEIGLADLKALIILAIKLCQGRYDAIHCHSSKAGALIRLAAWFTFQIRKTCYSPHGFSFLRRDVSRRQRRFFLFLEKLLHRLGGKIAAASATEKRYAKLHFKSRRIYLLENAIDFKQIDAYDKKYTGSCVRIVTSARITYAKAPWRFAKIAQRLAEADKIEFIWLGDGDKAEKNKWIGDSPVQVTGWLEKSQLISKLQQSDIFLLPSLWEGMPIALIEAQAMGIPAVVTNIVGNKDIVVHGKTGFLASSEKEMSVYTQKLIDDPSLRLKMGAAARQNAMHRFGKERLLKKSISIYFDG